MCSHGSVVHYVNRMMYLFDCKREVWNVAVEQKGANRAKTCVNTCVWTLLYSDCEYPTRSHGNL